MNGFIINPPYAEMVISGRKQWELRNRQAPKSKIGKTIFLLSRGHVLGKIQITKSLGPFGIEKLKDTFHLHQCDFTNTFEDFETFAWEIKVIERFDPPKRYKHPNGAQIWVKDVFPSNKMNDYF